MLKRIITSLFAVVAFAMTAFAANQPTISSGDQVTWYLLQFLNGQCVVEAQADGTQVKTAAVTAADAQLWKVEGNATDGYTLTSKTGQKLYTSTTAKNGLFYAAAAPTNSNDHFVWSQTTNTTFADGFVLSPKANTTVFMNQWGGSGAGKTLGLWDDRSDANQPFRFVSAETLARTDQTLPLIPYPQSLTQGEGSVAMSALKSINFTDAATKRIVTEFAQQLKRTAGITLNVVSAAPQNGIALKVDASLAHEAYQLSITPTGVSIAAADSTGFFYAIQTIKQLLPAAIYGKELHSEASWALACVEIKDRPSFDYRGFMLDISRHFFSKQEVMRLLDIMASYKFNRFHWHLTDDQGWRIEIPEYPNLTKVGSIRAGSLTSVGASQKFYDDTEYGRGCWYSIADLKEIVAYAKALQIEILPEIDMPGHMVAAVASYPEFSCDPSKTYSVRMDSGISKDVLNVGKDEVIDFLKCVLDHIADIFPYPYIHIGGDECPTDQWANNADCLKRVSDEGLSGVNELQSWLVETLGEYLQTKHNKGIVVWDELLTHWTASNKVKPVIMAWNNANKSTTAANMGFKSILTPYQNVYLDFMQAAPADCNVNEGYFGGWSEDRVNSLQSVYSLDPLAALAGKESFCMGAQGNMWTETCVDSLQLEYQLFPRLLALSETNWLKNEDKSWLGFSRRLQGHREVLDAFGVNYAPHGFEQKQLTPAASALAEAESILAASLPGEAGYPSQTTFNSLKTATSQLKDNPTDATALAELNKALTSYKQAAITQPEADAYYQIVSAASYYKTKYEGATIYAADGNLRFHYTPQVEPEEIWQFTANGTGYKLTNPLTAKQLTIASSNGQNVTLSDAGTLIRVDRATTATGDITYVPGAITISAYANYATTPRSLYAQPTGLVQTSTERALCKAGTWRLQRVTDFTLWLQKLVDKCALTIETAKVGETGEPTAEALTYLQDNIVTPGNTAVKQGEVSLTTYNDFMERYAQFLAMPRTSAITALTEDYYYLIRNAYFTEYYAAGTTSNTVAPKKLSAGDADFMWRLTKNADGTVKLTNKLSQAQAVPASVAADAYINLTNGTGYDWHIVEITTDQGQKGFAITDASETYSWYTNPNAWANNLIFKPKDWGASIWTFERLDIATNLQEVNTASATESTFYDLQGRRVMTPNNGIFITADGAKVIKK